MKETVIAILNINNYDSIEHIKFLSNKEFVEETKQYGNILSLKDFERYYNDDEIDFETTFIRFVEVELEVKAVK